MPKIKNIKLLFFVAVAGFPNISCAQTENVNIEKNQFIFDARKALIGEGWVPLETYEKTGDVFDKEYGSAKPIFDAGAVEVGFCSGTGVNYCHFHYRKDEQCLQVLTGGEYFKEDGSPKIINWKLIGCESLTSKE